MKYSIVSFKNVLTDNEIFRYDADYFHPNALKVLSIMKSKKYCLIEKAFDVTKLAGFEYTEYFTQENMASTDNYIALTSKNIQNEELNLQEYITIDKLIADGNLKRSKLQKGDVILSYTGEYRRALTLFEDNYQLGPNICLIRNKDLGLKSTYLSTFLNSRLGQVILDKEKTLSAQPTVAMSRIRKIPIPLVSESFQNVIDKCIKLKYFNIENSKKTYKQAEELLSKEFNLSNWQPKYKLYSIKKYSDVKNVNRFDAEYFQPKYDEIIEKIKSYPGGWDYIRSLFNQNKKSFVLDKDTKYNYVEIGSVNTSNGEITPEIISGRDLPANAKIKLFNGDILISKVRTYRGAVAIIESSDYIGSGAFAVLQEKTETIINKETLYTFLKLKPILDLTLKYNTGTSYPTITDEDVLNMPIPKFNQDIQSVIKKNVQECKKMQLQSKQLLEIAKRGVEMAIEENEDIATEWINEQLLKLGINLN
ncbi:MAG: restriction endonuclease subunit S [Candidatus Gastranaerophilales bacterium]|nr:restriction endonuclease subunit S [Candidatus Gastranaerophilales bacterium]